MAVISPLRIIFPEVVVRSTSPLPASIEPVLVRLIVPPFTSISPAVLSRSPEMVIAVPSTLTSLTPATVPAMSTLAGAVDCPIFTSTLLYTSPLLPTSRALVASRAIEPEPVVITCPALPAFPI